MGEGHVGSRRGLPSGSAAWRLLPARRRLSVEEQIRAAADEYEADIRAAGARYEAAMARILTRLTGRPAAPSGREPTATEATEAAEPAAYKPIQASSEAPGSWSRPAKRCPR